MRVLIIDDEEIICKSLKEDFYRFNHGVIYDVFTANSVSEAEQIYTQERIDIIISDINMPRVKGLTLIEKIRKIDKECLIFVLSAYDDFSYVRNAFKCGVNDYILKPISYSELDRKIKPLIKRKSEMIQHPETVVISLEERKMEDALKYIKEHLDMNLSMSNVAEFLSISYSYFSKLFRIYAGMTFPNYLLMLRMEKAKEYLLNPYTKISKVAQKVGYQNNSHHFSRDFSKYIGISPTEYRKNNVKNN